MNLPNDKQASCKFWHPAQQIVGLDKQATIGGIWGGDNDDTDKVGCIWYTWVTYAEMWAVNQEAGDKANNNW